MPSHRLAYWSCLADLACTQIGRVASGGLRGFVSLRLGGACVDRGAHAQDLPEGAGQEAEVV